MFDIPIYTHILNICLYLKFLTGNRRQPTKTSDVCNGWTSRSNVPKVLKWWAEKG